MGNSGCNALRSGVSYAGSKLREHHPFWGNKSRMQSTAVALLGEIESFCRATGIAESTFGRQAVNDGKLCLRLRNGKDVTLETANRIRAFIERGAPESANGELRQETQGTTMNAKTTKKKTASAAKAAASKKAAAPEVIAGADRPFRFMTIGKSIWRSSIRRTRSGRWRSAQPASLRI